jgi:hypothetical protein
MPAANTLLDIRSFVAQQRAERFRAFLIHGDPLSGKTTFARRMAQECGGQYIDVLDLVANDVELCECVDTLDTAWLGEQARAAIDGGASLVVLDEFDWLFPIWGDLGPFVQMVDRFYTAAPGVAAWVSLSHRAFGQASLSRADGSSRVLQLGEIAAL